jgi:glycosyltransferase involved in cell wall biosynthesis
MHICFTTIDYHQKKQGGGIASYLDALCPALVELGHQVTIIGPGSEASDAVNDSGVRVIQKPLGSIHWYLYKLRFPSWLYLLVREWEWSNSLFSQLLQLQRISPIDIIESHEVGLWQLVRKKTSLPPVVVRLHGSPYIFRKFSGKKASFGERVLHRLELKWLTKVAGISAPGRFHADFYEKILGRRVTAIPNPLAKSFLITSTPRTIPNIPIILYTGRIGYVKGSLILIEAFGRLLKHFPHARLIIAGARHNSISEATWQATLEEAGVSSNFDQLGHVPFEELQQYYSKASIFVMPSYYETFGISVIEAMAHGLPVVATRAGALPELIQDGINGFTVETGNPSALASAMQKILDDPQRALTMGKKGQERVKREYTPEVVATKLASFYIQKGKDERTAIRRKS